MKPSLFLVGLFILAACAFPMSVQAASYIHTLTWQDNSDNEDGFKVERKTPSIPGDIFGEIGQVTANVATYQDTVTDGKERCYRVRAFNASGDSVYTNEACGLPKPAEPGGLTISVTIVINIP